MIKFDQTIKGGYDAARHASYKADEGDFILACQYAKESLRLYRKASLEGICSAEEAEENFAYWGTRLLGREGGATPLMWNEFLAERDERQRGQAKAVVFQAEQLALSLGL